MQLIRRIPRRSSATRETPVATSSRDTVTGSVIPPSQSEETLNALNETNTVIQFQNVQLLLRTQSIFSDSSDATAVDLVIGHSFSEFDSMRSLPVVSMLFQKGVYVFPSDQSLNQFKNTYKLKNKPDQLKNDRSKGFGIPLLHSITPILSSFKKNAPILTIYKFQAPSLNDQQDQNSLMDSSFNNNKYEFCQVYCKVSRQGNVQYTLRFKPNPNDDSENFEIKLIMNSRFPFFDSYYKNTKLRWIGITSISSLNPSNTFKLIIINENSPSLLDHELLRTPSSPPLNENNFDPSPSLIRNISNDILANISGFPPLAKFSDCDFKKPSKEKIPQKLMFKSIGQLKVLEVSSNNDNNQEGNNRIQPNNIDNIDLDTHNNNLHQENNNTNNANNNNNNNNDGNDNNLSNIDSILAIPEASLVMTCMSLVIRDHEIKKINGVSRGFDTNPMNAGIYL